MRHPRLKSLTAARPKVGVIVDCSNSYGRAILRGITRYANLQRRWLLFKDLERGAATESEWPDLDAGIFAGVPQELVDTVGRHCRHVVYCSGGGDPAKCPVVALDDVMAGRQAAEHLLDCRLEHFGYYGLRPNYRVAENRLLGFRQAVEGRGFTCHVCPLMAPLVHERVSHSHRPALVEWLRGLPRPVGIFAFDDTIAHDLAEACLEAEIAVPDDVAIIGVNNDDLLCESAWPPLSSVEADHARMGFAAAGLVDRLFAGQVLTADERLVRLPPLGVVRRQSTSTLAIADRNLADAVRYIREHACNPCSVGDVLRHVPVARRWLERQFVAHLGRTPHDEIARVRIETAQRLLARADLDVSEIAARCGFAEPKNFYVAFRKAAGVTPAAYRRRSLFGH